jgi:two-component system nitrate/nitrite response regulator NarL
VVRALQERGSTTRVVLVTAGLPNHDALELIRLGIFGIFHKQQAPDELLRTIHGVAEGKVLIDQQYLQRLVEATVRPAASGRSSPSATARCSGSSWRASPTRRSPRSSGSTEGAVKAALQQLFAKTGVRTRSHLVRVALEKLRDEL